ncbi:MAG TPA: HEAT repeat domain-containing protein [Gemmatimonadaceae bacterium]|nr:HEAT repeat domain-containing protein [Gemmatimonadaceae bacterium]
MRSKILACLAASVVLAPNARAQNSLAARVSQAPDGVVRVTFASRPGTCGNGRDMIGYRKALFADNFQSIGDWNAPGCVPGPVRVSISKTDGRVARIRTTVGNSFPQTSERVTDLGMVSPIEASSYFFSIVPQIELTTSGEKSRILLPAVLANAGDVVPQLTSLARDESRVTDTRRQAIHWLGLLGDSRVVPTLVAFARNDVEEGKRGKKDLGQTAMAALAMMENDVGVPALIDLARDKSVATRRAAVFWLGQTGEPRALAMLHTVIENQQESDEVRAHAVFSLGQAADKDPSQLRYLQSIYPRASTAMKDQIFLSMSQKGGSDWLLSKARDKNEEIETRRKALFWAGQSQDTDTRDLAAVYRSATDESLKEHAIFVLSQRSDEAALNELMRIAQSDPDRQMRAKALFWLGQKDDPRVAKLIADKINR